MRKHITRRDLLKGIAQGSLLGIVPVPLRVTFWQEELRQRLKGRLITPTDTGYDSARRVASLNPTSDKHPMMIIRCAEPSDVVQAINFAREHSLDVAVRSGGHDLLGASVCDGMVIDLSPMNQAAIDSPRQTARVEAGIRAGELNEIHGGPKGSTVGLGHYMHGRIC